MGLGLGLDGCDKAAMRRYLGPCRIVKLHAWHGRTIGDVTSPFLGWGGRQVCRRRDLVDANDPWKHVYVDNHSRFMFEKPALLMTTALCVCQAGVHVAINGQYDPMTVKSHDIYNHIKRGVSWATHEQYNRVVTLYSIRLIMCLLDGGLVNWCTSSGLCL